MAYQFNEFQLKWLEALENGEYEQQTNYLKRRGLDDKIRYCCLGVACEIINFNLELLFDDYDKFSYGYKIGESIFMGAAPTEVVVKLKLKSHNGQITNYDVFSSLSQMNDYGASFKEIAKFCRENPEKVFNE